LSCKTASGDIASTAFQAEIRKVKELMTTDRGSELTSRGRKSKLASAVYHLWPGQLVSNLQSATFEPQGDLQQHTEAEILKIRSKHFARRAKMTKAC